MPRKPVPCRICGELVDTLGGKSAPEPAHRACQVAEVRHGTLTAFRKRGCRCDLCRAAKAASERGYRARRKGRDGGYVRKDRPVVRYTSCADCGSRTRSKAVTPRCKPCGLAVKRMVLIDPALRRSIYERDNWTCGFCGEPVEDGLPSSSPWQATLDHIVPRALGGTDDPEGLRLCHRWCNSVRSTSDALTLAELAS